MPMPTTTFQWKSKDVEEKRLVVRFLQAAIASFSTHDDSGRSSL